MTLTLLALPVENLHQICRYLPSHSDVSDFRLVCRIFGSVGLHFLAPSVSFVLLPESLSRLREISSHPVLRHHVYTVVCFTDVLPLYTNFEQWKRHARRPGIQLDWPVQPDDAWAVEADMVAISRRQIPDAELEESWTSHQSVLARQKEVFKALEHSREMKTAFRGFTNLRHLKITSCETPGQLGTPQTFKGLFDKCLIRPYGSPFYPSQALDYVGLPSIKPLKSLLGAALSEGREITSLSVDFLDCQFFDNTERTLDTLCKSTHKLRAINLGICLGGPDEDSNPWPDAKRALSTDGLKNFLCSAPNLEEIELLFDLPPFEPYIANTANIFPLEITWPGLRRIMLSGVEIHPASFLDFLRSHSQTLKSIELSNCNLVPAHPASHSVTQSQVRPQVRWSDVFIALSDLPYLTTLSLSSRFFSCPIPDFDAPHLRMSDSVKDVELNIGEALEMFACSKKFDDFLNREADCKSLDAATIKRLIIEDLVDHIPIRSEPPRDIEIPTNFSSYLKQFIISTE